MAKTNGNGENPVFIVGGELKKFDRGWIQHIYSSLNDTGRGGVVLDTVAASRGS